MSVQPSPILIEAFLETMIAEVKGVLLAPGGAKTRDVMLALEQRLRQFDQVYHSFLPVFREDGYVGYADSNGESVTWVGTLVPFTTPLLEKIPKG